MKLIMIAVVLFVLFLAIPTASADFIEFDNTTCVDGRLIKNTTTYFNGVPAEIFQNITCEFGCSDSGVECNKLVREDPNFVLFPIAMLFVAAIFGFLVTKTEGSMQMIFLTMLIVFTLISMGIFAGYTFMTMNQMQGIMAIGFQASIVVVALMLIALMVGIFIAAYQMKWKRKVV